MQKGDVKFTLSNTSLLKDLIGYSPNTDAKNGIEKFCKWFIDYFNIK